MVTIPTDDQAFAEYADTLLQTMPAKVRHVLLSHFEACLDRHVALKGLVTTAATLSEHDAEEFVSSAHACLRHARADTPLLFKAALDAIVAFDRTGAVATGRRLQPGFKEVVAACALWLVLKRLILTKVSRLHSSFETLARGDPSGVC